MQISFVGHSHHKITKSSEFFLEMIRSVGDVRPFWDESWRRPHDLPLSEILAADLVIVWQVEEYARALALTGHNNVVFVPMFDSCGYLQPDFWGSLKHLKIIAFSSAVHRIIQQAGFKNSAYFQYFPNADEFRQVRDFSTLRGFFWQRRPTPSWGTIRKLLAGNDLSFSSFCHHRALDPGFFSDEAPDSSDIQIFNIKTSSWLPNKGELLNKLEKSNVYFAPRCDEGIGMGFLEAMAMGMVVCANDAPTHNEYITHESNGFLYTQASPRSLDLRRCDEVGQRARESVEIGYARWVKDRDRMVEILLSKDDFGGKRFFFKDWSHRTCQGVASGGARLASVPSCLAEGGDRSFVSAKARDRSSILVTVATVVKDAPEELALTLESCLSQSLESKELVIVDGCSKRDTLAIIDAYSSEIDYCVSEIDLGPYDAMNKAARVATGRWIVFMNAGDVFVDEGVLERVVRKIPEEADFATGHYLYLTPKTEVEEVHYCAVFEHTYRRLLSGEISGNWLGRVPGHQATFTRTSLLQTYPFDLTYRFAADHEFMYRMRSRGALFHHIPAIISMYRGGGLSWQNVLLCIDEWWSIALRYTRNPEAVDRHFREVLFEQAEVLNQRYETKYG